MNIKRKFFNLIEVMLAIGVISFGFTSVMSIMIIAASQTRDATTETIITQIAESVFGYLDVRQRNALTFNRHLSPYVAYADQNAKDPDFFNGVKVTPDMQKRFGIQYSRITSFYPLDNLCASKGLLEPQNTTVADDDYTYYMTYNGIQKIGIAFSGLDVPNVYPAVWTCRLVQNDQFNQNSVIFSCFVRLWRQNGTAECDKPYEANTRFKIPSNMGMNFEYETGSSGAQVCNTSYEVSSGNGYTWNYFTEEWELKQRRERAREMYRINQPDVKDSMIDPLPAEYKGDATKDDANYCNFTRMWIEVSWPIDIAEEFRNKRIFYREFCQ